MGHKRILAALLAAAALFGAAVSGCNRDGDSNMASAARGRGQASARAERDGRVPVRPAEVLSASVRRDSRRPARRQARPQYERGAQYSQAPRSPQYVSSQGLAQYEPLPEPIPLDPLYASRGPAAQPSAYQLQSGPRYESAGAAPVYNQAPYSAPTAFVSEPYTLVPSRTRPGSYEKVYEGRDGGRPVRVHPSPELTVARAQLQGSAPLGERASAPAAPVGVPLPTPESFPAPIPELEPIRSSRTAPGGRPAAVSALPARVPVVSPAMPSAQGRGAGPVAVRRIMN